MKHYVYIVAVVFSFVACSGAAKNKYETTIQNEISIIRFDKDFNDYLKNPSLETEELLKIKYPNFLSVFGLSTIGVTLDRDPENFFPTLREYFGHAMLKKIYSESLNKFENVSSYESELEKANKHVLEYFPKYKLPKFSMHVSGFKENVIVLDNTISISVDKYLGPDYKGYKEFFQDYQLIGMQPKMLVRDYLKAWLISDVRKKGEDRANLLAAMVEEGKTLYFLSVLLPDYDPADLIGYTTKQADWAKKSESDVWKSIVKQNHLYTTDYLVIDKYVEEAPFTATISPESPGQLGCWIGWQIVSQYMKKTNKPIGDLIDMDAQSILKEAKYNP